MPFAIFVLTFIATTICPIRFHHSMLLSIFIFSFVFGIISQEVLAKTKLGIRQVILFIIFDSMFKKCLMLRDDSPLVRLNVNKIALHVRSKKKRYKDYCS